MKIIRQNSDLQFWNGYLKVESDYGFSLIQIKTDRSTKTRTHELKKKVIGGRLENKISKFWKIIDNVECEYITIFNQ